MAYIDKKCSPLVWSQVQIPDSDMHWVARGIRLFPKPCQQSWCRSCPDQEATWWDILSSMEIKKPLVWDATVQILLSHPSHLTGRKRFLWLLRQWAFCRWIENDQSYGVHTSVLVMEIELLLCMTTATTTAKKKTPLFQGLFWFPRFFSNVLTFPWWLKITSALLCMFVLDKAHTDQLYMLEGRV